MLKHIRGSFIEKYVKSNLFLLYTSNFILEKLKFLLPYEEDWLYFKDVNIPKKNIIIDIGSHWGESAITFSKYFNNKIFCFEPNAIVYKKLINNTKNLRVDCHNFGIGKYKKNSLFFPCFRNNILSLWGSHDLGQLKNRIDKYTYINPEKIKYKKIIYTFKPLPNYQEKISIIKIDVEGAEYNVFKIIKKKIIKDLPIIFVEYNENNFSKLYLELLKLKYKCYIFKNKRLIKINQKNYPSLLNLNKKRTLNVIFKQS